MIAKTTLLALVVFDTTCDPQVASDILAMVSRVVAQLLAEIAPQNYHYAAIDFLQEPWRVE